MNSMQKLIDFLERLRGADIPFRLDSVREAVMVAVMVPGEHWEVEFFPDGHVEVEVYTSDSGAEEGFEDESSLERLFAEAAEAAEGAEE